MNVHDDFSPMLIYYIAMYADLASKVKLKVLRLNPCPAVL